MVNSWIKGAVQKGLMAMNVIKAPAPFPTSFSSDEKRVIVDAALDFFDRYTTGEPFLSKLSALYACINALKRRDSSRSYEHKAVFEVLYQEFGYSLFSQYTGRNNFHARPSPEQLKKTVQKCLLPAAHYFLASAELWEYGVEHFGIDANTQDGYGNTSLMAAAKNAGFGAVESMLRNISESQHRLSLIYHQNIAKSTALDIAVNEFKHQGAEGYKLVAKAILSYLAATEQEPYLKVIGAPEE